MSADVRLGRTMVTIPSFYFGMLADVRIEQAYGMPMITRVEVIYDRGIQLFTVNNRLLPGQGIEIQLDPYRRVRSIVVYTNPRYRGGVTVWAK